MKLYRLAITAVVLSLIMTAVFTTSRSGCAEKYRTDMYIQHDSTLIPVEVARTPQQKDKGLGGRECINVNQAMLFVFNKPGSYAFWMKDMKFPIDMLWLDAGHKVVHIEPDVSPSTYPRSFVGREPAQYVIELKSGQAKELNIQIGSLIPFTLK